MRNKVWVVIAMLSLAPLCAYGQNFRGSFAGSGLRGINGAAGFGFAEFDVESPGQQFTMDDGVFAYVGGERSINDRGLFLTLSFNYMKTEGESFYNYTTLGGTVTYQGSNIPFDSENYQLALGIKQKFFPNDWFRPYIEGGGLFGFHEIKHNGNTTSITCGGCGDPNGFKSDDTLAGFGYFGEAGIEVDFSENYGVRAGARYQFTETREFETLANQKLRFTTLVFQFAIQRRF